MIPESQRTTAILVLSGALLGASFPPFPFGALAFVGFAPLLVVVERSRSYADCFTFAYRAFFVFHGIANAWIAGWPPAADAFLIVCGALLWIVHPALLALPILAYRRLLLKYGRTAALFAFPFLWVAFEWLHSLGELAYPWLTIGMSMISLPVVVQCADLCGVWGLSFLIAAVNAVGVAVYAAVRRSENAAISLSDIWRSVAARRALAVLALLTVVISVYGINRLREYDHSAVADRQGAASLNVGVIQANINPWQKWSIDPGIQIVLHKELQDSMSTLNGAPDVTVWSETAIPVDILQPQQAQMYRQLAAWVDSSGAALLTGFRNTVRFDRRELGPSIAKIDITSAGDTTFAVDYNAALLLRPGDSVQADDIYRKIRLAAFAEGLPYAEFFGFARTWFEWDIGVSTWARGVQQNILTPVRGNPKARIGCCICVESMYPGYVREFVRQGATALAVITNDGWYNYTLGPRQHWAMAQVRAIENRRYIIRAANTGLSGFISPDGKAVSRSLIDQAAYLAADIPLMDDYSLYAHWGDWLPKACVITAALMLAFAYVRRGSAVRK